MGNWWVRLRDSASPERRQRPTQASRRKQDGKGKDDFSSLTTINLALVAIIWELGFSAIPSILSFYHPLFTRLSEFTSPLPHPPLHWKSSVKSLVEGWKNLTKAI
jgi:hypothetical protein